MDRYDLAQLSETLRANSITIISPATLPWEPSNRLGLTQVGLSLIVGLFGGVSLALVLDNLDTRIHSSHQLERLTGLPVLGVAPQGLLPPESFGLVKWYRDWQYRLERELLPQEGFLLTLGPRRKKSIEEAFRLMATHVLTLSDDDISLKTILITSAVSREGKSTTTVNLAQALVERGQTLFLIDGDLRRSSIEKLFDIDDGLSLSKLLDDQDLLNSTVPDQAAQPARRPSLFVVGSGSHPAHPTELLASPSMAELTDYLGDRGLMTLMDAPPVLGAADVSVMAPIVDGIILVTREAYSKREQVLAALKQLQASRAQVLGFVFLQKGAKGWLYE
jgi:capsular exopolysaccharide synthesis family protein